MNCPNDPPCCERCGMEYNLRDGDDPSKYCDPCAQAALLDMEKLYDELIMAVARKFTGESRHETALRYIRDAERRAGSDLGDAKTKESL